MKTIGVGLLGLGTVGSGVVKALAENGANIGGKLQGILQIKRILVRDLHKAREVRVAKELLSTEFSQILADPSIDIVVDVMGGIDPAKEYILQALNRGKHVVTANKEVVAKYGWEILRAAQKNGVSFLFEASVAGGIPIIRPLKQCLAANKITEIMGIINGTTNYILSKMATEGKEFSAILREAQEKGYAEPDPTSDVEGFDAAYKLAILASLAFGSPVKFEDVSFEGISGISREDIAWAAKLGCVIKLVALAREREQGLEVRVSPCLLSQNHPLARIEDVFNAVLVKGNLAGELMFTGRGAGGLPTASAVVADMMAVARNLLADRAPEPVCSCYRAKPVIPDQEIAVPFYLRVSLAKADALLPVHNLLVQNQVPFTLAVKKLRRGAGGTGIFVTRPVKTGQMDQVMDGIHATPGIKAASLLRLEGEPQFQVLKAGVLN